MAARTAAEIPQVLAIVRIPKNGRLALNKRGREHLGLERGATLRLEEDDEVLLSSGAGGTRICVGPRGDLALPGEAALRLDLRPGALVAVVQRAGAVALKLVEVAEEDGPGARLVDRETPHRLTRVAVTNPTPDEWVHRLAEHHRGARLRQDVGAWLSGCTDLETWQARSLLGRPATGDEALRRRLIEQRQTAQRDDGSWDGELTVTARQLRELAALDLDRGDESVARGAAWLLARPESAHNPGMFFGSDELVARQIEVADGRKAGRGGRFREIRRPEQKRVMLGDDLIEMPCGPRLMWPNALALEALIAVGAEDEERVGRALTFMSAHDWCECGYQHGLVDWRRSEPLSEDELAAFEARCMREFRYGGLRDLDRLLAGDDPKGPVGPPRTARRSVPGGEEYDLRPNRHIQGCEFVTTRALARVREPRIRRFAAAHLWRFAGRQHGDDGSFGPEKYGTGFSQAGILGTFARYEHPVVPLVVMRAIPWIVANQNGDGTWGADGSPGAATLAVLAALSRLGDHLPEGMRV